MRPTKTGTYDPPNLIKSISIINYWVIDADTHVLTPLLIATPATHAIVDDAISALVADETTIEAADKYLSSSALMRMNPHESQSLMRFTPIFLRKI